MERIAGTFSSLKRFVTALNNPLANLTLIQAVFLVVGVLFLSFTLTPLQGLVAVVSAATFELLFMKVLKKPLTFPTSALAAGFGIALFFRASHIGYFVLAAFLAIASKYFIKLPWKGHIFNPSNFAVVVLAISFPSSATLEFTQWGSNPYVFAALSAAALFVAWRAKVLYTTVSFLLTYTVLLILLLPHFPVRLVAHHYGLIGPTLILFASFMITDPRTSPQKRYERIVHGVAVAVFFFVLEAIRVRYSIFIASFLITIMGALLSTLYHYRPAALRYLGRLPANTPVFLLVAALFTATIPLYASPAEFAAWKVSPEFLLMGTESRELVRPDPDPLFTIADNSEIESSHSTPGVAWRDYDNDGWEDLFLSRNNDPSKLYRNNGDGTFTDVTSAAGLPEKLRAAAAVWGDYDNDGNDDLFIQINPNFTFGYAYSEYGYLKKRDIKNTAPPAEVALFRNTGSGTFIEVSETVGLKETKKQQASYSGSLALADLDLDGDLDLLETRHSPFMYIKDGKRLSLARAAFDPTFVNARQIICGKEAYREYLERLRSANKEIGDDTLTLGEDGACILNTKTLRIFPFFEDSNSDTYLSSNDLTSIVLPSYVRVYENSQGRFVERPEVENAISSYVHKASSYQTLEGEHPFSLASGIFWQTLSYDFSGDRLPDIVIGGDFGVNLMLKNEGNFTFINVTEEVGANYSGTGMGITVSDYDHDGLLDLFINNALSDLLLRGVGGGFENSGQDIGRRSWGWGTSFLDYNLDGWDDLIIASGFPQRSNPLAGTGLVRPIFMNSQLYQNDEGRFVDKTWEDFIPTVGYDNRSLAVADYDNNGTPDFFIGSIIGRQEYTPALSLLYRNTLEGKHYLKIRLEGTVSNRDGVGAVVSVARNGDTQTKPMLAGDSFSSQNSEYFIFGLGDDASAVSVRVAWPSGRTSILENVAPNQTITITE